MKVIWPEQNTPLAHAVADFVSAEIYGQPGKFGDCTVMGVVDGNTLVGGVLYYDYDADAGVIQISAAATTPRWLSRRVLWELFNFPFNQIGCQAVVLRVDPDNARLRRILTAYGFDNFTIPRLRGRNKAETLFILGDDVWRANGFHEGKTDGQKST